MQGGTAKRASPDGEGPVAFDFPRSTLQSCGSPVRRPSALPLAPPFPRRERGGAQSNAGAPAGHCPQRPEPCSGSLLGAGSTFSKPQVAPEHSRGCVCGGEQVQCARLSSSARQVPCPQHLHLSPAHHPARMLAKLKRGMCVPRPRPRRNRPTPEGPGAPERTRLSCWNSPAEIPLTLPCN